MRHLSSYAWLYIGVVTLLLLYALLIAVFEPFADGVL